MISVREAKEIISSYTLSPKTKEVTLEKLSGFVLADDIFADRDYPPFNRATMDGFAIDSKTYRKEIKYKVDAELPAGYFYEKPVNSKACIKIMTGAPVPKGLDAIIKNEDSEEISQANGDIFAEFKIESVNPYFNIAKKGEDVEAGKLLLPRGHFCNPQIVGLLATVGITKVKVMDIPTIAIISTGTEIVHPDKTPLPFQIRDSNLYTIFEFLKKYNLHPEIMERIPDDRTQLSKALELGMNNDILIVTGGVSAGSFDLIPAILESLGAKKIFHKIKVKPGKPVWFGQGKSGCSIFALPGNPFSVQVTYKVFVENFIRKSIGLPDSKSYFFPIGTERQKKNSLSEFFPVSVMNETNSVLEPIANNGSGDIKAGLFSDGIAIHPEEIPVLQKGDIVEFLFW